VSMPTDGIAPWFALVLLALAILTRLFWRAKWRRDDRRRRISLMEPDPTPYEDDDDAESYEPTPTLREQSIPMPADMKPVKYSGRIPTPYGLGVVHSGCLVARRDAAADHICAECGDTFTRVGV
jgi:hypothetical protein